MGPLERLVQTQGTAIRKHCSNRLIVKNGGWPRVNVDDFVAVKTSGAHRLQQAIFRRLLILEVLY